ncbi:hypothetical protein BDU57DRAFT_547493 [Ampelomyces quisqualis]|uniref:Uncharacterized protein n=1 Tax=Ampelomyces quisqualis TaxID=50730 RepID=A0A6A5QSS4_AMPQU|nr:hypothetical protein BDU57DRAFT_547493 [Ampelomyces quisqualis]
MFRNLATTSSRTLRTVYPRQIPVPVARYSSTTSKGKTDVDDKHAVNKANEGETSNIQEANAKAGMDANTSGTGGNATDRKDSAGGVSKAKKDFPEAPDPAIGMQDERGGRGG